LLVFFAGSDRIHPQSNFGNSCFFLHPQECSPQVYEPFGITAICAISKYF